MHQDGFILVFRDVLYDDDPPSVGPRGGIPPLGVVMIIVGRELVFYLIINRFPYFINCTINADLC